MKGVAGGVLALVVGLGGCSAVLGIEDHALGSAQDGDGGDDAPSGIDPPDTSAPDTAPPPDAGGPGTDAEVDAGLDAAVCAAGDLRCNGNAPQKCAAGAWQDLPACGGATPVCSNGVCGSFRTTGGIRSTAPVAASAADGGPRLVSGGFEFGTRTCNTQGMCVTGGIVP